MRLLLAAATSWELRPALLVLRQRGGAVSHAPGPFTAAFGQYRIHAEILGIGADRASGRLQEALRRDKPDKVLLLGFSGGARSGQRPGDITRPCIFSHFAGGQEIRIAGDMPAERQISVAALAGPAIKEEIGRRWPDACGVDMESYALARVCAAQKVPMECLRAIFDPQAAKILSVTNLWRLPLWYLQASGALSRAFQNLLH